MSWYFSKNFPRVPPSLSSQFLLVLEDTIGCKIGLENRSEFGNSAFCWYWPGQLSGSFSSHRIIRFSSDSSRIEIYRKSTKTFMTICKDISATIQDWFVAFDAASVCPHLSPIKQGGEKLSKSLKTYSGTPWHFFSEKKNLSNFSTKLILSCCPLKYKRKRVLFTPLSCKMYSWEPKKFQNIQCLMSSRWHSFSTIFIIKIKKNWKTIQGSPLCSFRDFALFSCLSYLIISAGELSEDI